ncbi:MAG: 50S ribosomal protein L19 [Candidatus Hatepunaea meridiana]|nr:50S ribosomal protein L19 [Candidatus Hatepunaea meridiana]
METWKEILKDQINENLPAFNIGDTIDVHYRVVEGEKERIQIYTGVVISRRGAGLGASFTVRKIGSGGIGVERVFPSHSPFIADIKVKKEASVRRAKLYYLRQRKGKAARLKEKSRF